MHPDDQFDAHQNPYAMPESVSPEPELRPFHTIWTRPRETVRAIVEVDPRLHVVLLACLAGIGETLSRASMGNAGDELSTEAIIAIACLMGPLGGLLSLWISSFLLQWSGYMIGGIGDRVHIRTAIAWASVPAVFALPLWIVKLLLFGSTVFTEAGPRFETQPTLLIPFLGIAVVEMVLGIWSLVLACNTIAEVQGYRSAWAGLGNIFLAGFIVVVAVIVLVVGAIVLLG